MRVNSILGWMAVNAQESPWKELVAPERPAAAARIDAAGHAKFHLLPYNK